jgi:hypothetical protein
VRRVSTQWGPQSPGAAQAPAGRLAAPAYLGVVADTLQALEPASWAAFASAAASQAHDLHADLLRSAYRLDAAAHPQVGEAAGRAAAALGVEAPVTVYQLEGGGGPNATLLHAPDEAVVALSGTLLTLLTTPELTAILGHELAHHVLWTGDGGRLLVADRLLEALALDARTPPAYLETARRWALATELAADRGSLLACGDLRVAVAALLKTATGLPDVDPDGFLAQAAQVDPSAGVGAGRSHPETVLRAWAQQSWSTSPGDADEALGPLLGGGLDVEALDLLDRARLEALTRRVVEAMLAPPGLRTAAVLAHARQFFPDLVPAAGAVDTFTVPARAGEATRRYLGYVLLDLATVDPDLEDAGLLAALTLAARTGLGSAVADAAATERLLPSAALARLVRLAEQSAGTQPRGIAAPGQEVLPR